MYGLKVSNHLCGVHDVAALYSALPLPSGRLASRLLTLLPSSDENGDIHCKLRVHAINAKKSYEAVSYSWDKLLSTERIFVNSKPFMVTAKLAEMLRTLRSSTRKRTLWIDAVCINQDDLAERSQQVQNMGQIFRNAHQVVIWLGAGNLDTHETISMLLEPTLKDGMDQLIDNAFGYDARARVRIRGLQDILRRRWWTRVWVVQELALAAGDPLIVCGTDTIPWSRFADWIRNNLEGEWLFSELRHLRLLVLEMERMRWEVQKPPRMRDFSTVGSDHSRLEDDLCRWLRRTALFDATDPRDKLYALIGLTRSVLLQRLHVDYSAPVSVVSRSLVHHSIRSQGDLDVLTLCHPGRDMSDGSWIPDFTVRGLPWLGPIDFAPALRTERLWEPGTQEDLSVNAWVRRLKDIHMHAQHYSRNHLCSIGNGVVRAVGHQVGAVHVLLKDSIDGTCGETPNWHFKNSFRALRDEIRRLQYRRDMLTHELESADAKIQRGLNGTTTRAHDRLPVFNRLLKVQSAIDRAKKQSVLTTYTWQNVWRALNIEGETNLAEDLMVPYMDCKDIALQDAIVAGMRGRRQFVTDTGLLGLGPVDLEEGDEIVTLLASRFWFVVRRKGSGHALVGQVFVAPANFSGVLSTKNDLVQGVPRFANFDMRQRSFVLI